MSEVERVSRELNATSKNLSSSPSAKKREAKMNKFAILFYRGLLAAAIPAPAQTGNTAPANPKSFTGQNRPPQNPTIALYFTLRS